MSIWACSYHPPFPSFPSILSSMSQLRSKTNSSLWNSSLAVNGIQKYSGARFPCVGWIVPSGQPFPYWATVSTVDPRAFGQPDCWASTQVPGFHFYPLLGQEPRLNLVQLAEAPTLFLSFCQLSLFLVFLPWSICRSLGQDSGQQDARKSCFPECHTPPLALRSGPSDWCWPTLHLHPLQLHLNPHSDPEPELLAFAAWVSSPALCQPPQQNSFSQQMPTYPSLQLVLLLWQISPC